MRVRGESSVPDRTRRVGKHEGAHEESTARGIPQLPQVTLTARTAIPEEEPAAAAAGAPRLKPVNAVAGAAWPAPATVEAGARPNPPNAGFGALSPVAVAEERTTVRARCPQSLHIASLYVLFKLEPAAGGKGAHTRECSAFARGACRFDVSCFIPGIWQLCISGCSPAWAREESNKRQPALPNITTIPRRANHHQAVQ
jgi:hypothetical protein